MLFAEGSLAKTYRSQEDAPDWPEPVLDSTGNWCEPFAWFDRVSRLWRTWQRCFLTGWEPFSETWPRAGLVLSGIAYRRAPSAPLISVTGSGLLPTPIANDGEKRGNFDINRSKCLPGELRRGPLPEMLPTPRASDGDRGGRGDLLTVLLGYETKHAGTLPTPTAGGLLSTSASPASVRSGRMNPRFREWMMGMPIGWTELEQPETKSSRKSRS